MKYFFIAAVLSVFIACKQKELSGAKLDNKLIETMQNYLDKESHPGITFKVKDVTFFAEKKDRHYICNFHVNMHTPKLDTTGIMVAVIPNDFSNVKRMQ